jgi:Zn-dependent M28 family amino/carboxypeptidase
MALSKTFGISSAIACTALLLAASIDIAARADALVDGALTAGSLHPPESEGAFRHLRALQDIAEANGGNRAAGTPGYDRSADYVAGKLNEAGYLVRFEEFEFPFFEERTPPVLLTSKPDGRQEPAPASAVRTLYYSGSNDVTAPLRGVDLKLGTEPPPASSSGCEPEDFKDFERGAIALIRRGTCPFQAKVDNAIAAGAIGVVIMNQGTEGQMDNFSGRLSRAVAIPVVGVTYELGRSLDLAAQADGGARLRLAVDVLAGKRLTKNVLADIGSDYEGSLIVVGAHLDSVPEGPGINDNGSGSAAVLEAALQFAKEPAHARGRVRFAFWGAEERGLVGSRHHVASLSEQERRGIALYINLDMVGSPNHGRFLRGPGAAGDTPAALVQREFAAYFRDHDLPVEERSGGGRFGSDDASFSQKGVPTVGLFTGAAQSKAEPQANMFGGAAGRPYDPCYHRACDTVDNIDREVLEQNTRALVRALGVLAMSLRSAGAPVQNAPELPKSEQ